MKLENFESAVSFYTTAINLNPRNAVYFCNRAAAYSKIGNYAGAVRDCEEAISIDPGYSKAYGFVLQMGAPGGFDLAGLLNNPGFMSMASNLMNNPQVQQLMSGMISGPGNPMAGAAAAGNTPPTDLASLIQAGQQFAQQMQQQNPELIEQLRSQIRSRTPSASNEDQHQ
ncbi:hypothetical protein GDO78_019179 [Eleutherodactylus coqui]|uniref:STI1 domain-containing protein n=1 Tax=Eleutherodactylus coqui TaxID=57060 RepID=A0A8J6BCY6_ELECQ|nr:hypothetical protein GDO78_019179 [Eleutherodactylus coqui]